MQRALPLLSTILILLFSFTSFAQPVPPNCPPTYSAGYNITGDSISFCLDGVNLTANGYATIYATNQYNVDPIPYNPYPWVGGNSILVGQDDIWSGVVNLPFPFCFFGQKYNSVVIGANGQVGFDVSQANGTNAWASNGLTAPINNAAMNNTIMTPYHDIHPGVPYPGASITWDIYGTPPCRYMVISWDSIPMFSCTTLLSSQQVVLFESTYLIDINIKNKPLCSNWNGGVAHEGVQNASGTAAFMVPGRNGTTWTAANDSYRFTPSGQSSGNFIYYWIDIPTGDTLATGPNLNYYPTSNSQVTIICSAVTDCDTVAAFYADTVNIIVTGNVVADFSSDVHLGCTEDTVNFTNNSVSTAGGTILYQWDFGDLSGSTDVNPTHIYADQNLYTVRLIAEDNGCLDTITKVIDLRHPIKAEFLANPDSVCLTEPIVFEAAALSQPGLGFITYHWNFGDGTAVTTTASPTGHTYLTAGAFDVQLIVQDTLGCRDTVNHGVYVDEPPFVAFLASKDQICLGEPVSFIDTVAPATQHFFWNFGDGQILTDVHNPTHTFAQAGNYVVSFTGEYLICKDLTVDTTITVNSYPSVDLGPDQSICPGITGSIVLSDNNNPSATHEWNTGEISNAITVTQPGYYWVKASNGECSTTDSIWIQRDCYLNIPNSFSPDGDGLNDYFLPRELLSSGLSVFKMKIFNRWGEQIFTTTKIDGRGWDGKYDGKDQPMGVYVYVIDVVFKNNTRKNFKGNVTLVR